MAPDQPVETLTGYYDASGHGKNTPTLVLCGWLSTAEKWKRFDAAWRETLTSADIATYFRMSDFMTKKPPYDKRSDQARADLLRTLIGHLRDAEPQGFAESVPTADWTEANKTYALENNWCVPYSLAGFYVMNRSVHWWGNGGDHGKMDCKFIFETGDDGYGKFVHMMEHLIAKDSRLKSLRPLPGDKTMTPLQAADMCAWPLRVATDIVKTETAMREPIPPIILAEIMRMTEIPCIAAGITTEHILNFCAGHDVPKQGENRRWNGLGGSTAQDA